MLDSMTRAELQERLATYGPRTYRNTPLLLCLFILVSIVMLVAFIKEASERRSFFLAFFVLNSGMVIFSIWIAIAVGRERANRFKLRCLQCRRIIAGRVGDRVVSTGRCPSCGFQITSD
jgi:hypothetical protein